MRHTPIEERNRLAEKAINMKLQNKLLTLKSIAEGFGMEYYQLKNWVYRYRKANNK